MNTIFWIGLWGVAAERRAGRGRYSRALGASTQSARLRIPLNSFGFGRSHRHAAGQYIGAAITRPIGPRRYWPMPWLQKFPTVATATGPTTPGAEIPKSLAPLTATWRARGALCH